MFAQLLTNKGLRANLILACALMALPGCTGAPWEKSFWSPPAASGTEKITTGPEYPVQRASGENLPQEWPNLADVPAKGTNPLPASDAERQLGELSADHSAATARANAAAAAGAATSSSDIKVPAQAPLPPPEL